MSTKNNNQTYEELVPRVKARDHNKCQRCGVDNGQFMIVVRRNQFRPDGMRNLETVCRKHIPEWE